MYYRRAIETPWLEAGEQFPVLLLTGPRQVGKTTVLKHLCGKDRRYVTLDDPNLRHLAGDDPALFLQRFPPPVLIDEIQYAPALLPQIKMIADEQRRPGQFWLTGSQQFEMMRGISETLAGRVAIVKLLGFSLRERHRKALDIPPFLPFGAGLDARTSSATPTRLAGIYRDIWRGTFPALNAGSVRNRELFYSSYLQTYLQRDIRDLRQIGNEAAFVRFLRVCAARTAQMLNLSELARDADVSVPTAKTWLSLLQTTCQVFLLRPYYTNVTKRLVKAPKLYFLDTGLCSYLTEWSSPETLEAGAMSGAVLETFVLGEILKSWWHRMKAPPVYYYRDRDRREVDVLFVLDQRLHPLEVKKSATIRPAWATAFAPLDRLGLPRGPGGVACLCPELLPVSGDVSAIPVGML